MIQLAPTVQELAREGVLVGTSSWKYPGWMGQLYTVERYETRGKFSQAKFNATCLAEYAETFPTVCVDAAFYTFPKPAALAEMAAMVPEGFRFGFKVTDAITVRKFPNVERSGARAGQMNEHFLDAALFTREFLGPLETIRDKVGPLIFEFGHFHKGEWTRGLDFVEALDRFLAAIPRDWQYGVEVRNKTFLQPEYFDMLQRHGVAHTFNSWQRMPPVSEQLELAGALGTADFLTARFLLTPGRSYAASVKAFEPYNRTQAPDPGARAAGRRLIAEARQKPRRSYLYFNNRLEGNALNTIGAVILNERTESG